MSSAMHLKGARAALCSRHELPVPGAPLFPAVLRLQRPSGSLNTALQGSARRPNGTRLYVANTAEVNTTEPSAPAAAKSEGGEEYYEVFLDKPLGVRFSRGRDGGAYVVRSEAKLGNVDPRIEAGDQIVAVSASFGDDVWEAKNFGQVMYAIKTRNGEVYIKFKKNYGDLSSFISDDVSDTERAFKRERGGGNYGMGTKEKQTTNYLARKDLEARRRTLFDQAMAKFQKKDIPGALIDFEEVISMEPKAYLGDNFSRVTQIFRVAQYNVACCYSAINQVDPGLEALDAAMAAGFEQFGKIRSDENLAALRASPKFTAVINKYDEPVINDNAIKALKGLFNFGRKQED